MEIFKRTSTVIIVFIIFALGLISLITHKDFFSDKKFAVYRNDRCGFNFKYDPMEYAVSNESIDYYGIYNLDQSSINITDQKETNTVDFLKLNNNGWGDGFQIACFEDPMQLGSSNGSPFLEKKAVYSKDGTKGMVQYGMGSPTMTATFLNNGTAYMISTYASTQGGGDIDKLHKDFKSIIRSFEILGNNPNKTKPYPISDQEFGFKLTVPKNYYLMGVKKAYSNNKELTQNISFVNYKNRYIVATFNVANSGESIQDHRNVPGYKKTNIEGRDWWVRESVYKSIYSTLAEMDKDDKSYSIQLDSPTRKADALADIKEFIGGLSFTK